MFSSTRNCVQIVSTWGPLLCCCCISGWHDNGPHDLITVSLCISVAINKMYLCLWLMAYVCLYCNPSAIIGHCVYNVDISKRLTHIMPNTRSALWYSVNWDLSVRRTRVWRTSTVQHQHLPTKVCYNHKTAVKSRPHWGWCTHRWASLRWFVTAFAEIFGSNLDSCCISCPDCWSQTILQVKKQNMELIGWHSYMWSAILAYRILTYDNEINLKFTCSIFGGNYYDQYANCTPPQNSQTAVILCCLIKVHILRWPFIVSNTRHTCCLISI